MLCFERSFSTVEQQRSEATDTDQSKPSAGHVYETVAKFLLVNRFHLTALEFHTELLELGHDLPYLREFFSDSSRFESSTTFSSNKATTATQPGYHQNGDSHSLFDAHDDCLSRILNMEFFDTTSVDNLTIYSKDLDQFPNGSTEAMTSAQAFAEAHLFEERIALLEWELRKARETIAELRPVLSADQSQEENPMNSSVENQDHEQSNASTNTSSCRVARKEGQCKSDLGKETLRYF